MQISKIKLPGSDTALDIKDTTYQFAQSGNTLQVGVNGGTKSNVYTPSVPAAANNGTFSVKTKVGSASAVTAADFTANQSSNDDITFVQGSNVTLTTDTTNRTVTIASTNTWRPLGTSADTACAGNDSRLSNARPASDVYSWAKQSSKPSYSFSEISGSVSSSQLPSYVDDVLEYDTRSAFPATGEGGKIYVDKSNNTSWRWSGSTYTQIKGDLTIGTTSGTVADGKVVNDHINNTSNPHGVTKAQVGLGSVVNTGDSATPVSGGTTKFTTGGAYTEFGKKANVDDISVEPAGHDYVEIGGVKWATMNIGANSVTDTGLYFQWGDTQGYTTSQAGSGSGKKYFGWEDYKYGNGTSNPGNSGMTKYNSGDSKTVLETSDDAVTAAWGGSWRMPTDAEFVTLGNSIDYIDASGNVITTTNKLTTLSGVTGIYVADKNDHSKRLFFPAAGFCYDGSFTYVNRCGFYWSSSLYSSAVRQGRIMDFLSSGVTWQDKEMRSSGFSVRGVYTGDKPSGSSKVLGTTILDSEREAWNNKVDKVSGKGLSTNDYTTGEKNKLAGIAAGAEVNVQSDWNATSGDAAILNKPTIPAAAANGTYTVKTLVGSTTTDVSDFTANQSSADDVTFVQGSNVTITPDATNRKITIAAKDTTYSEATTSAAGLMSSSDKGKLNGIESGAQTHKAPTAAEVKSALGTGSGTSKYLREDGSWVTPYAAGTGVTISGTNNAINVTYGTSANTACQGNDSRLSNSRPASDVYSWAKASSKPTYIASEVMSISAQSISANTSSSCSITGSGNAGKAQTIVYVNSGSADVTVTVPTTYKTPANLAIELTCPVGGYCEVSYLNIGGTIYARGL